MNADQEGSVVFGLHVYPEQHGFENVRVAFPAGDSPRTPPDEFTPTLICHLD